MTAAKNVRETAPSSLLADPAPTLPTFAAAGRAHPKTHGRGDFPPAPAVPALPAQTPPAAGSATPSPVSVATRVHGTTDTGTTPHVIGLDLSLTSTGIASSRGWTERITSKGHRGDTYQQRWERLIAIGVAVDDLTRGADLVVIEAPSYGSVGSGTFDRSGLWWLVVDRLLSRQINTVAVPPTVRCRYATSKGNASKDAVLAAAVRRFPAYDIDGNDIADAVWLMALGMDAIGHQLAVMPESHHIAVASVAWPDIEGLAA